MAAAAVLPRPRPIAGVKRPRVDSPSDTMSPAPSARATGGAGVGAGAGAFSTPESATYDVDMRARLASFVPPPVDYGLETLHYALRREVRPYKRSGGGAVPGCALFGDVAARNPSYVAEHRRWMVDAFAFDTPGEDCVVAAMCAVHALDRFAAVHSFEGQSVKGLRSIASACLMLSLKATSTPAWEDVFGGGFGPFRVLGTERVIPKDSTVPTAPAEQLLSKSDTTPWELTVAAALDGTLACPATVPAFLDRLLDVVCPHLDPATALAARRNAWYHACVALFASGASTALRRPSCVATAAVFVGVHTATGLKTPADAAAAVARELPGLDMHGVVEAGTSMQVAAEEIKARVGRARRSGLSPGGGVYTRGGVEGIMRATAVVFGGEVAF